jgi:hypothetical protein
MRNGKWLILPMALMLCAGPGWSAAVFEYPTAVLDLHDADMSCWIGMDASGTYPVTVVPRRWLVGAPPSEQSAVTLPADHWADLGFSGEIVAGPGDDILLVETGKAGEQALLFVTDGADREYLVTRVSVELAMTQELSSIGVDLDGVTLPFVPRAVRIVALDLSGLSAGFDLCSVQARVSHDVRSFPPAESLVIDDFEDYVDAASVRDLWRCEGDAGLALEQEIFETCQQSMAFHYCYDVASHSVLARYFDTVRDWTRGGALGVEVILHGDLPDPAGGELYIAVTDGVHTGIVSRPVVADMTDRTPWQICRIAMADFGEIDLTQIRALSIGVRPVSSLPPGTFGAGTLNLAEIRLYATPYCEEVRPRADLTDDGRVDYRDLERMAGDWLREPTRRLDVALPKAPVLWYEFDGNANDRMGRAHGQILGRCNFAQGVFGQAIQFLSRDDAVVLSQVEGAFAGIHDAITIAFWQKGDDSGHLNDTLLCSNYVYGQSNPAIAIHLGCWRNPGQYRWDCGFPWSFDNRLAGRHRDKSDWTGRWNHWAFTKDIGAGSDGEKGRMEIYLNGEIYDRLTGTDAPIAGITSLQIGSGWYGHYDGLIDDVQIYDYALSAAEIAFVATDGAGVFERPASPADLNADESVDLRDLAALAVEWLSGVAWP